MQSHYTEKLSYVIICCMVVILCWAGGAETELTDFHGEFLGQTLPGLKPEPFAPEIFSVWGDYGFHLTSSVFFSAGGKELFFTDQALPVVPICSCSIWQMQRVNSTWARPRIAPFSEGHSDKCVGYANDGTILYFASTRPVSDKDTPGDLNIWFVKKEKGRWTAPAELGYPINTSSNDIGFVLTNDGTVFLSSDRPGGQGGFDVYQSRFIDGQYTSVRNLGDSVNTDGGDHIACAAPDASFLILYHLDVKDKASGGLYITFRKGNGIWTTAKSMGDHINSHNAQSASLSPDGKFLFFLSRGDGMYWLRADLIEYLNNEDLSVSEIMIETFQREGLSAALAVYAELKDRHADFIDIDEYLLNQRGHTLLYSGHVDEAIVLFKICVALDPDSWNAYDSLGEAYIEAGLIDQAIESYEKSLELNARNKNAAVILERLRR